jgi:4-hydroxy-tetrahydrodipicolinate synthase
MVNSQGAQRAQQRLRSGAWGVMVTPFTPDKARIDERSLAHLVEFYVQLGISGLTVLGSSGEVSMLSPLERRQVVDIVTRTCADRPVVVGVISLETAGAIAEIQNVADLAKEKTQAYMVQVNSTEPDRVVEHLQAIHKATGASILLQDHPRTTGVNITVEDLGRVLQHCDFIRAVKLESSPSPLGVLLLKQLSTTPIFGAAGGAFLLDELACGSAGVMTAFSVPEGLIACCEAFERNGIEQARSAWLPYMPLVTFETQLGISHALRKEALTRRGLIGNGVTRVVQKAIPPTMIEILQAHLEAIPGIVLHGSSS